ncbi:hypothetical protein E2C01_100139 [Portunus trituberculatus]|uniref:C2H2-type domain-containing protein n=1 Tax=Portunus trituberculatus TaxID=210409 RepID=A0A5B7KGM3_PORTR|nr:hypothetical protein [Portunus trituberculatus]
MGVVTLVSGRSNHGLWVWVWVWYGKVGVRVTALCEAELGELGEMGGLPFPPRQPSHLQEAAQSAVLRRHLNIHADKEHYTCPKCPFLTTHLLQYDLHMMTHT